MPALRLIFHNLDHFRRTFAFVFFIGSLSATLGFLIPVVLAEFTSADLNSERFLRLAIIIAILFYAALPLQWILRKYGEALGSKFSIHLRLKYFHELQAQPISQLVSHHSGYALALIATVADGLGALSVEILWGLTHVLTNLSLFVFFTARQSGLVAAMNIALLILFVALSTVLARRIVPLMRELNLSRASLLERYSDFAANTLTVKRLALFPFVENVLRERTGEVYERINAFQSFHAYRWFILHALFGLAYISTIVFLLWQISGSQLTPAVLILFVASYATVRGNIERLAENLKSVIEINASIENLLEVLPPLQPPADEKLGREWKEITLRDVEFSHPGSNLTIRIPEFSLRRGEKVFVAGPSGEGKTTLLNIVAGYYHPDRGERAIDGLSYTAALQSASAFISQEAELFNMSLTENFLLGTDKDGTELDQLLQRLDLYQWSQRLEKKLDTKVGERGLRLSAGQRQRINLIRGLLLEREVYLLDEPTSHLDRITELKVIALLRERLEGKTAIIVSHREAVAALCSRSYVFESHCLNPMTGPRR